MVRAVPDDATGEVRLRIAGAARALFAERGYESTTVDAIAERAGIARRTFFRYFRSKDDAIFPDHDRHSQAVARYLDAAGHLPPVAAVCGGARIIFLTYLEDKAVAIERYRVARSVPALRHREIASVSQYTAQFSRYLRSRFGDAPDAELRAGVAAGAIIAAHNQVLRAWLRSGGDHDPLPALDAAFAWVVTLFEDAVAPVVPAWPPSPPSSSPSSPSGEGDVVVAVFRAGQPLDDVVERITRSL